MEMDHLLIVLLQPDIVAGEELLTAFAHARFAERPPVFVRVTSLDKEELSPR